MHAWNVKQVRDEGKSERPVFKGMRTASIQKGEEEESACLKPSGRQGAVQGRPAGYMHSKYLGDEAQRMVDLRETLVVHSTLLLWSASHGSAYRTLAY